MDRYLIPSILDQAMFRSYIDPILVFPLSDLSEGDNAVEQLHLGLRKTLQKWPYLVGRIYRQSDVIDLPDPGKQNNLLVVRYSDSIPEDLEACGIFSSSAVPLEMYPYTYADFERMGFPTSLLKADVFKDIRQGNQVPIDGLPITVIRVKFIDGALCICVYIHHLLMDAAGADVFLREWASNCKSSGSTSLSDSGGRPQQPESVRISNIFLNTQIGDPAKLIQRIPGWCLPSKPPLGSSRVVSRLFRFSMKTLDDLKERLNTKLAQRRTSAQRPFSTFTALSAILWHKITLARAPRLDPNETSCCGTIFSFINRGLLPKGYFPGNTTDNTATELPVSVITNCDDELETLVTLGLAIRSSIDLIDTEYLKTFLSFCASLPDPMAKTEKVFARGLSRAGIILNNWAHVWKSHDWGIRGCEKGTPQLVRKSWTSSQGEGVCIFWPRLVGSRDDYEVQIGLNEGDMMQLCKSTGLVEWAYEWVE